MTTQAWLIRRANWEDAVEIARLNQHLARETENRELPLEVILPGVRRALERPGHVRYWVATVEGKVIGQTMITPEWSDWRNGWKWWLQSVYVEAPWRGKGVFASLVDQICLESTQLEKDGDPPVVAIWLYAEVENSRALEVYQRLGFADAHYKVLEMDAAQVRVRAKKVPGSV